MSIKLLPQSACADDVAAALDKDGVLVIDGLARPELVDQARASSAHGWNGRRTARRFLGEAHEANGLGALAEMPRAGDRSAGAVIGQEGGGTRHQLSTPSHPGNSNWP